MKQLKEMRGLTSLTDYVKESLHVENVDELNEGLKDVLAKLKEKFKDAIAYLKGYVAKVGNFFLSFDRNGAFVPAVSPLNAGEAYLHGGMDHASGLVVLDKAGAAAVGLNTTLDDALKLPAYTKYKSDLDYLVDTLGRTPRKTQANESIEEYDEILNEVKIESTDPESKYAKVVDNDELAETITFNIKNTGLARLMIWGAPGIGKTAIIDSVVKTMKESAPDFHSIVKTLSNETADNFTLPAYTYEGDDVFDVSLKTDKKDSTWKHEPTKAKDVPKSWLPVYEEIEGDDEGNEKRSAACGRGLLFIDELSRATPQVLNVILPLINESRFNGYKLGKGWSIVCASNRAEDELSGQTEIGNALSNRFDQVWFEPTVHSWKKWAKEQNFISPLLIQWLEMPEKETLSGGKFFYYDPNEKNQAGDTSTLICTPRSWTNAMRKLAVLANTADLGGFTLAELPNKVITRALGGFIPSSVIDSFIAFIDVIRKIGDFDIAVKGIWQGHPINNLDPKDLRKIALPFAQLLVTSHANKFPTAEEFENLADWLVSQNSDQLTSYVLDIFKNVFLHGLSPDAQESFFIWHRKRTVQINKGNEKSVKFTENEYDRVLKPFKLTVETMPDFSVGLKKISNKYGEIFMSVKVNGKDGLG